MIATLLLSAAACSWAHPGASRFTGTDAAVDDYKNIPAAVRAVLRARMQRHDYDDIATITHDRIFGGSDYDNLRDMHFGSKGRICQTISRPWKPEHQEQGLVYCEGEHCVIVPSVCGNIALVTRRNGGMARGGTGGGPASAGGTEPQMAVAAEPLPSLDDMPPTGAGTRTPDPASTFAQGSAGPLGRTEPLAVSNSGIGYPILWPGAGGGGSGGVFASAVPEPSTWASLLAGLAVMAAAMRRAARRR